MLSDINSFGRFGEMVNRPAVNIILKSHPCIFAKWFFFFLFLRLKEFLLMYNKFEYEFSSSCITCKPIAFKQ